MVCTIIDAFSLNLHQQVLFQYSYSLIISVYNFSGGGVLAKVITFFLNQYFQEVGLHKKYRFAKQFNTFCPIPFPTYYIEQIFFRGGEG